MIERRNFRHTAAANPAPATSHQVEGSGVSVKSKYGLPLPAGPVLSWLNTPPWYTITVSGVFVPTMVGSE
jgi:hypothetical protein